jgi:hypothetical protein
VCARERLLRQEGSSRRGAVTDSHHIVIVVLRQEIPERSCDRVAVPERRPEGTLPLPEHGVVEWLSESVKVVAGDECRVGCDQQHEALQQEIPLRGRVPAKRVRVEEQPRRGGICAHLGQLVRGVVQHVIHRTRPNQRARDLDCVVEPTSHQGVRELRLQFFHWIARNDGRGGGGAGVGLVGRRDRSGDRRSPGDDDRSTRRICDGCGTGCGAHHPGAVRPRHGWRDGSR